MPVSITQPVFNYLLLFGLFLLDFIIGNGVIDVVQKALCRIVCFTKKIIIEEAKHSNVVNESPISFSVFFTEILVLTVTVVILNKYKRSRASDKLDELLDESKDSLRQTNEFLEKWRMRRVQWQMSKDFSYLDEEPQVIKPLRVEIPILHMAIIDTLGTNRSLERGDAGDSANITNSAILSVTSLDDDYESIPDQNIPDDVKNCEFGSRHLWNVMEEDSCEHFDI
ncbi:uncharacterized protein LOC106131465 [Amyelois transitella]|uniref:uncharacterized protein LOC106131465 n=1 Tax=Amyelois transitella TaxID=680683 RepID=UPI00298F825C|nr:uncharacterized protein LOC106131465 [Amyelois transitella]